MTPAYRLVMAGSLVVVGTGIRIAGQLTEEALLAIRTAEKLFYLVNDGPSGARLAALNPSAESLEHLFAVGKARRQSYEEIVEHVLSVVREGRAVCLAFYGHPGVFCTPGHEAVRRARGEGLRARMLPGISAHDSLIADLGLDPGDGCQTFEATRFLVHAPTFDRRVPLVLWQIGNMGRKDFAPEEVSTGGGLGVLAAFLGERYGLEHEVLVYWAALLPGAEPVVQRMMIEDLRTARVDSMATLYVPPVSGPEPDPGLQARLNFTA